MNQYEHSYDKSSSSKLDKEWMYVPLVQFDKQSTNRIEVSVCFDHKNLFQTTFCYTKFVYNKFQQIFKLQNKASVHS